MIIDAEHYGGTRCWPRIRGKESLPPARELGAGPGVRRDKHVPL